ncbi:MAG: cysteine hydrolase [Candidatus Kaiserbacteria bacterium]|nr:MAG: cysteine hydrolase [Candidatus Kaiserbacteria bacterium]
MSEPLLVPYGTVARPVGFAVLIIDMQPEYFKKPTRRKRERMLAAQQQALAFCATIDIPVAMVEFGAEETITEISASVHRVPRSVRLRKHSADAFFETCLDEQLHAWHARTLVLAGLVAGGCVLATARSALSLDYNVRTSEALIGDEDCDNLEITVDKWYRERNLLIDPDMRLLFGS